MISWSDGIRNREMIEWINVVHAQAVEDEYFGKPMTSILDFL